MLLKFCQHTYRMYLQKVKWSRHHMKKELVGERIRKRRKELGLTQTELAIKTGYSDKSAISKIENRGDDLNQSKIAKFAEALDTTPSYLMGWTEDPAGITVSIQVMPNRERLWRAYEAADDETQKAVLTLLNLGPETVAKTKM